MSTQPTVSEKTPVTAPDAQLAGPATVVEPAPPANSPPQTDGTTLATEQPAPVRDLPANPAAPQQEQVQLVTPLEQLGDSPAWIDCPWCHRRTKTVVRTEGTTKQIFAGILCCLLCVCLACVPCIAGWFEDTIHSCGECSRTVATKPEGGGIIVHKPAEAVPSKYAQ
ncbi:hypothetical protein VTJ04DRAFT_10464 [Mycothermus thermophilus]|uniref:uncharacterized protein n=1 Tax=Humicola insolens TaxID=85995 RepID=UPI003742CE4E